MKLSGATIIRNGVRLGYPFIESIRSILPVCDEVVVGVGDSDDGTRERIAAIGDPKLVLIDTKWDMSRRTGGTLLSEQTNLVLPQCRGEWVFYIQADEVAHEEDFGHIRAAIERAEARPEVDGLAFRYLHFYGSYYTVQSGRNWYPEEVRIIRNGRGIRSHGDAQGFRRGADKVRALLTEARMCHYGWARPPDVMAEKVKTFHQLWHDDDWITQNCSGRETGEFFADLGNLVPFTGTHPAVMKERLNREFEPFILRCRDEYLKRRRPGQAFRDLLRRLPLGRHRNFKLAQ